MAEDKENIEQGQEEYQYSGEEDFGGGDEFSSEFASDEYSAPVEESGVVPSAIVKKFAVPGIIVAATVGLYMYMSMSSSPSQSVDVPGEVSVNEKLGPPAAAPEEPPVQQAVVEPPIVEPSVAVAPPVVTEPPVTPDVSALEAEQRALAAMRQNSVDEQAKIKVLNDTINELQVTVGDLGKAIIAISSKLDDIEQDAKKTVVKSKPKKRVRRVARPRVPPMVYEVKSAVPGRAWIQSSAGELMTIEIGQTLPGYGKVENINPAEGSVTLSSGAVISYGLFDR